MGLRGKFPERQLRMLDGLTLGAECRISQPWRLVPHAALTAFGKAPSAPLLRTTA